MKTILLLSAATAALTAARAFDGEMAAQAPAAAELAKMQEAHTAASNAVTTATQAEVDAKAKVAQLEGLTPAQVEANPGHAEQVKAAKAEVATATKALKAAKADVGKAVKAIEKAQKAATKEAETAAKAQAKAAEDAEKAKAAEEAKKAAAQPTQNDITRPKADSQTGKAWAIFDEESRKIGSPASIGATLPVAVAAGINEATVRTQYARWRKFNGVSGRIEAPKPATPPAPPVEAAPPVPPAPPAPPVA